MADELEKVETPETPVAIAPPDEEPFVPEDRPEDRPEEPGEDDGFTKQLERASEGPKRKPDDARDDRQEETDTVLEPAKPAKAVERHSPALIREAVDLLIPDEDIDKMTPAELERTVNHARRVALAMMQGQKQPAQQTQQAAPAEKPVVDDLEAKLKKLEEDGHDPLMLEQVRENAALKKQLAELAAKVDAGAKSQEQQARESEQVRVQGVLKSFGADVAGQFDLGTRAGQNNYDALIKQAVTIMETDRMRGQPAWTADREAELLQRAIANLGLKASGEKKKEEDAEAAVAERRKTWKEGALSDGGAGGETDLMTEVRKILRKGRREQQVRPPDTFAFLE